MIIGRGTSEKCETVIFGLSLENIRRMLGGEPIHVTRHSHGDGVPEGYEFVIFAGQDEETMAKDLMKHKPDIDLNSMPRGADDYLKP